jgi:hypothetical protein
MRKLIQLGGLIIAVMAMVGVTSAAAGNGRQPNPNAHHVTAHESVPGATSSTGSGDCNKAVEIFLGLCHVPAGPPATSIVTVYKYTNPAGDATPFSFTFDGAGAQTVSDGGHIQFSWAGGGVHTISEVPVAGYSTHWDCSEGTDPVSFDGSSWTYAFFSGSRWTCRVTNTKSGGGGCTTDCGGCPEGYALVAGMCVPLPSGTPGESRVLTCLQTSNYGWSSFDLGVNALLADGEWRRLFESRATVFINGREYQLTGIEPDQKGGGMIIAPLVPGKGASCDVGDIQAAAAAGTLMPADPSLLGGSSV